jgi:hypothetical protein
VAAPKAKLAIFARRDPLRPIAISSQRGDIALVAATINAASSACTKVDRIVYGEFRD